MEYSKLIVKEVICPLVDKIIEPMDCVDVVDGINNTKYLDCIPKEFKQKRNFIEICKNCKWHNY